jgi:sec-independent protein translocase protein TatA
MFGISGEHIIILAIVLIFFGPRRLPELGHTLGKAIRNFKESLSGLEEANYRKIDSKDNAAQNQNTPAAGAAEAPKDSKQS